MRILPLLEHSSWWATASLVAFRVPAGQGPVAALAIAERERPVVVGAVPVDGLQDRVVLTTSGVGHGEVMATSTRNRGPRPGVGHGHIVS